MLAYGLDSRAGTTDSPARNDGEAKAVDVLRLFLAVAMLAVLGVHHDAHRIDAMVWAGGLAYACYGAVVCFLPPVRLEPYGRTLHWFDLAWALLLAAGMNATGSDAFLIFLFPALAASLRYGMTEGTCIALAATALSVVTILASGTSPGPAQLVLHAVLIGSLGGIAAYWGGTHFAAQRRLALLHAVNRMAAKHSDVQLTIDAILGVLHHHFGQGNCTLILREKNTAAFCLRSANGTARLTRHAVDATVAMPFLSLPRGHAMLWGKSSPLANTARALAGKNGAWSACTLEENAGAARIAQLLGTRTWISVPVATKHVYGRLYIGATHGNYSRADAELLGESIEHACLLIEEREHNGRLVAEAASSERRKVALDLHDTAVQPYIGLAHGLAALRRKSPADHPLTQELEKLAQMTSQVIADLRAYACNFKDAAHMELPLPQALQRRAEHAREQYGIDIALDLDEMDELKPELAKEVLQIVSEGMNNICKHSRASHGAVRLRCLNGKLGILIENEGKEPARPFTPRSISERAAMLGGSARVRQSANGVTSVLVEIPVY